MGRRREKTFEEVLRLWMDMNRIKYKGSTEKKYQYMIDTHIIPELGKEKISQLTAPKINAFLMEKMNSGRLNQQGGLSPSYVRSMVLIINSAIHFAVDEEMCKPLKTPIYKPPEVKKELSILNLKQQRSLEKYLLDHMDSTSVGILLTLHTGLRIGEVCALSWDDIDLENEIIHIRHTVMRVKSSKWVIDIPKTRNSYRMIPISSQLLPILSEYRKNSCSVYVIPGKGSFVNPRTYEYRYHKILEKCELPSINYHALRHTFATRCIEAGVDVKSLSEILGHSNVGITLNTYVHSSMELKRMQIEKLRILADEN